jgi:hypothetical protein
MRPFLPEGVPPFHGLTPSCGHKPGMPECLPVAARAILSESFREYPRLPCQHPQDVLHSKTALE